MTRQDAYRDNVPLPESQVVLYITKLLVKVEFDTVTFPDFSPLNNAPFATESQQDAKEEDNGSETSLNDANKAEARQRALEQQIRDHTLKLQQQRSALIDMPPEEALERARHNLQVVSHST